MSWSSIRVREKPAPQQQRRHHRRRQRQQQAAAAAAGFFQRRHLHSLDTRMICLSRYYSPGDLSARNFEADNGSA